MDGCTCCHMLSQVATLVFRTHVGLQQSGNISESHTNVTCLRHDQTCIQKKFISAGAFSSGRMKVLGYQALSLKALEKLVLNRIRSVPGNLAMR